MRTDKNSLSKSHQIINGRYILHEEIGRGKMGVVYRATDRLFNKTIALKKVQTQEPAYDIAFRLALANEFQILAGLRHPNIISVLDYGFDGEKQPFFTMSYIPNGQTILEAGKDQPFKLKADLIHQLVQAMAYLHRRGVLHCDLKPDNVLVVDGVVKVLDFGLSDSSQLGAGGSAGTPLYMAPENFDQGIFLPASDLFAVGVLAYELLVNIHPFAPYDFKFLDRVLEEEPDLELVDFRIRSFISNLLQKNPQSRPQNATSALTLLADSISQELPMETAAIRESYLQAAKFIGREAELNQLTEALGQKQNGVWLVGGESGVGKSRLLNELRTRALVDGWQVLTGYAIAEGGVPFQLWQEIIPRLALGTDLNSFEIAVLKEVSPSLDSLLGQQVEQAESLTGTPQLQRLSAVLTAVLQRQSKPTLLLLEDLHWSQESLYPIKHLLKVLEELPALMVVGTYRVEEKANLPEELPGSSVLALERLSDSEVLQLSKAMLGEAGATPQLVDLLNLETEGNTFFIVEVIRNWAETFGELSNLDQAALPAEVLTSGMESLLNRRLEAVSPADRPLLELAAVAGRQIDWNLLSRLGSSIDLDAWVQRISETAILSLSENHWMFDHDKLRQAILTQLSPDQLKNTHRQVALAIEDSYPDDERYNAILLIHWREAGDTEQELAYIEPVADYLVRIPGDYEQAEALYKRGLELVPEEDETKVKLLNSLTFLYRQQGRYEEGFETAQLAMKIALKIGDNLGLAASFVDQGLMSLYQGKNDDAEKYLQKGLSIRQELNEPWGIAVCFNMLGINAAYQGDMPLAEDYFEKSLEMNRQVGDRMRIADNLSNLGQIYSMKGNYSDALDYIQKGLAIREEFGEQDGIARDCINLSSTARIQGDYVSAHNYCRQSGEIWQALGNKLGAAIYHSYLGMIHYAQGAFDEAILDHQKSLDLRTQLGALPEIADNHVYIALSQAGLNNSESAIQAAADYFELCEKIGSEQFVALAYLAVAQTLALIDSQGALDDQIQDKIDFISRFTKLESQPVAYFDAAVEASTDRSNQLHILISYGNYLSQTQDNANAIDRLKEARTLADEMQLGHRIDEIDLLLKEAERISIHHAREEI
ncbi:MAG: tetratricopeptide repeat protein [Chloroflexota bacterium]